MSPEGGWWSGDNGSPTALRERAPSKASVPRGRFLGRILVALLGLVSGTLSLLGLLGVSTTRVDGIAVYTLALALITSNRSLIRPYRRFLEPDPRESLRWFASGTQLAIVASAIGILAFFGVGGTGLIAAGALLLGASAAVGGMGAITMHKRLDPVHREGMVTLLERLSRIGTARFVVGLCAAILGLTGLFEMLPRILALAAILGISVLVMLQAKLLGQPDPQIFEL